MVKKQLLKGALDNILKFSFFRQICLITLEVIGNLQNKRMK